MADHLQPIVVIGVVGGRDHYPCNKRAGPGEVRNTGSCDDTREAGTDARTSKPSRNLGRKPRAALAGIHSDQHFGVRQLRCMLLPGPHSESHPERMRCSGIQRRLSRNAPNAVGTKKLSCQICSAGSLL